MNQSAMNPYAFHDHRVIASQQDGAVVFTVHEVHYDAAGRPVDHLEPTIADGASMREVCQLLASMQRATELPALSPADFGEATCRQVLLLLVPQAA
jgi:hypothetical protein